MRYLLDTNICIYLMQHHPPEVAARFAELEYGDVVISAIALAELRYGVECRPENRAAIEHALEGLLADVPVMSFDEQAAVGVRRPRCGGQRSPT
jgi:tRNA(fMet)-specific endonuclease VapC